MKKKNNNNNNQAKSAKRGATRSKTGMYGWPSQFSHDIYDIYVTLGHNYCNCTNDHKVQTQHQLAYPDKSCTSVHSAVHKCALP